jgi:putative transcriptional regulator
MRKPRPTMGTRTNFGLELEESGKQILAHMKGCPAGRNRYQKDPQEGMSQGEFARAFCINPRTLQEWEPGRRQPDAATRAYLAVIEKNRRAVLDALAS